MKKREMVEMFLRMDHTVTQRRERQDMSEDFPWIAAVVMIVNSDGEKPTYGQIVDTMEAIDEVAGINHSLLSTDDFVQLAADRLLNPQPARL